MSVGQTDQLEVTDGFSADIPLAQRTLRGSDEVQRQFKKRRGSANESLGEGCSWSQLSPCALHSDSPSGIRCFSFRPESPI